MNLFQIDLLLTKMQIFTSQDVKRTGVMCGLLVAYCCVFFQLFSSIQNLLRNEMLFNFSQDFTVFHSFPEGHLDRRGESGQEQS